MAPVRSSSRQLSPVDVAKPELEIVNVVPLHDVVLMVRKGRGRDKDGRGDTGLNLKRESVRIYKYKRFAREIGCYGEGDDCK